jgi:hypothetical protein
VALEQCYRVAELSELFGFCENTIIKLFANEPGVLRLGNKRKTLSIPESVVLRVRERLSNQALQTSLAANNKLRVIRLRDLDRRVPQKARNVIKLQAA